MEEGVLKDYWYMYLVPILWKQISNEIHMKVNITPSHCLICDNKLGDSN